MMFMSYPKNISIFLLMLKYFPLKLMRGIVYQTDEDVSMFSSFLEDAGTSLTIYVILAGIFAALFVVFVMIIICKCCIARHPRENFLDGKEFGMVENLSTSEIHQQFDTDTNTRRNSNREIRNSSIRDLRRQKAFDNDEYSEIRHSKCFSQDSAECQSEPSSGSVIKLFPVVHKGNLKEYAQNLTNCHASDFRGSLLNMGVDVSCEIKEACQILSASKIRLPNEMLLKYEKNEKMPEIDHDVNRDEIKNSQSHEVDIVSIHCNYENISDDAERLPEKDVSHHTSLPKKDMKIYDYENPQIISSNGSHSSLNDKNHIPHIEKEDVEIENSISNECVMIKNGAALCKEECDLGQELWKLRNILETDCDKTDEDSVRSDADELKDSHSWQILKQNICQTSENINQRNKSETVCHSNLYDICEWKMKMSTKNSRDYDSKEIHEENLFKSNSFDYSLTKLYQMKYDSGYKSLECTSGTSSFCKDSNVEDFIQILDNDNTITNTYSAYDVHKIKYDVNLPEKNWVTFQETCADCEANKYFSHNYNINETFHTKRKIITDKDNYTKFPTCTDIKKTDIIKHLFFSKFRTRSYLENTHLRDYSVDEKSDALFREFSRVDPLFEDSYSSKIKSHHAQKYWSSSANSVSVITRLRNKLIPQFSIEEEYATDDGNSHNGQQ